MGFTYPLVLLLLALPVGLGVWEWVRRGQPLVLPFDHSHFRAGHSLRRLVTTLNLAPALLLAMAILLLAGPFRLAAPEKVRAVTNIEFVLDVSGSMMSQFGDGNRSDKALQAINEFTNFRKGDAFGLTVFGNEVLHWVPVTKDLSAIRLSAPFLRPDKMPPYMGGTMIGKALRSVRRVLAGRPEGDRMVILISDGESFDLYGGQAEEIGHELASDKIHVYYIHVAVGEPQNETFALASTTGGRAYAAGDPAALREVFQHIDQMQPAKLKPRAPEPADWFRPWAVAGLGFLGLHLVSLFGLRYTPW